MTSAAPSAAWRLGTRRSPLSRAQASLAQRFLRSALPRVLASRGSAEMPSLNLQHFVASGDRVLDRPLAEIGGKGLFTKELDRALLDGTIDLAVHSAKDMESTLATGTAIAAYLPRGERRDCLVMRNPDGGGLASLARAATIGTSSPRREALVKTIRPDLNIQTLRGNIERRLRSLDEGKNDAIVMARCALQRLGITVPLCMLDEKKFLPAAGQGAIALVARSDDAEMLALLREISDITSHAEVSAERAFLKAVSGSCYTPLGASAHLREDTLTLTAFVIEGGQKKQDTIAGKEQDAETLGRALAQRLLTSLSKTPPQTSPQPPLSEEAVERF